MGIVRIRTSGRTAGCEGPGFASRPTVVLVRWWARIGTRRLLHEARHTLQGRLMVLVLLFASPGLVTTVRSGGPIVGMGLDESARLGALVMAHLCGLALFAVMLPVVLSRKLVLDRQADPLEAHPAFQRDLAAMRMGTAVLSTAVFVSAFLHLFYAGLVRDLHGRPILAGATHLGSMLASLIGVGVGLAMVTDHYLRSGSAIRRARRIRRYSILPFGLLLPALAVGPSWMADRAPQWLVFAGEMAADRAFFLIVPIGASAAIASASAGSVAGWLGSLAGALGIALVAVRGWRTGVPMDLVPPRESGPTRPRSMLVGGARNAPRWWHELQLFRARDVAARRRRGAAHRIQFHGAMLVAAVVSLTAIRRADAVEASVWPSDQTVILGLVIAAAAVLALARAPGCLGEEGDRLVLLRPVLSFQRLFRIKATLNTACVVLAVIPHAGAIHIAAVVSGFEGVSIRATVATGVVAALLFALFGTAVGFLVPDLRKRSASLPGVSLVGRLVYCLGAGGVLGGLLTIDLLRSRSLLGQEALSGLVGLLLVSIVGVTAVVSRWALRRLETDRR